MTVIQTNLNPTENEGEVYERRVTYKGGVIIPIEIRRLLGVKPRDVVRFRVVQGNTVLMLPPPMTLEETFGSVKPKQRPLDFKKLRDTAIEEHVEKVINEMRTL